MHNIRLQTLTEKQWKLAQRKAALRAALHAVLEDRHRQTLAKMLSEAISEANVLDIEIRQYRDRQHRNINYD